MNRTLLSLTAALALASVALSSGAFAADTFDRTIPVSAQPDLYISTGSGNIHIHPGPGNQIHIIGHIHASWSAFGDVQHHIQQIVDNPPITQSGNAIHVGDSTRGLLNNISIDYDVTAPTDVALNLRSGSGDIEVADLSRWLSASNGSGDIRAHGIHGAATLDSGSGDIEVTQQGTGDIKAKTGSGSIRVHNFSGNFWARTGSGDIEADGNLTTSGNISTGSGDVRVHLDRTAHFNLEASTGSGDIRVNFPGAPKQSDNTRHHLTAPINGGGLPLEIRTGSGDIEITPR
ncbi:MAG: DUF4097 family beta strand repeat-containing protein [Bryocella sp.]